MSVRRLEQKRVRHNGHLTDQRTRVQQESTNAQIKEQKPELRRPLETITGLRAHRGRPTQAAEATTRANHILLQEVARLPEVIHLPEAAVLREAHRSAQADHLQVEVPHRVDLVEGIRVQ